MTTKTIIFLLVGLALASVHLAEAQQPSESTPDRISVGFVPLLLARNRIEAFRQGLRELGYVEGQNIVIEYRYAEGKPDRLPYLAAELVRLKVDVIVVGGSPATRAAKECDQTIPIVMAQDHRSCRKRVGRQPCAARRKHHGAGHSGPELSGKRLELLKEISSQALPRGGPRESDRYSRLRSAG